LPPKKTGKENTSANVVDMDSIRKIRAETATGKKPDSAIITRADLDRIRQATVITSKEEKKAQHNLMKDQ
jgi:hypothetical protein